MSEPETRTRLPSCDGSGRRCQGGKYAPAACPSGLRDHGIEDQATAMKIFLVGKF